MPPNCRRRGVRWRSQVVGSPLKFHGDRDILLVTSTLTIVEVAFDKTEKDRKLLDISIEQKIDKLWYPNSGVRLVDFHQGIARRARELMRIAVTRGWKSQPVDAIHPATAETMNVSELHTYNIHDFEKLGKLLGIVVTTPTGGQIPGQISLPTS